MVFFSFFLFSYFYRPVPTAKPILESPIKRLSKSIDTGEGGDQDLNIISDELNNLTKKAEQLGVYGKPGLGMLTHGPFDFFYLFHPSFLSLFIFSLNKIYK